MNIKSALTTFVLSAVALMTPAQSLLEKYAARLTAPQRYDVYRTTTPIKLDGKLSEAAWQAAAETAPFADISGEGYPAPAYRTTAKMLWDDNYLYIGATLEEPNITASLKTRDAIIFHDNDFEVFIDPDGDGINYFEYETNAFGTLMDLFMPTSYRVGGNFVMSWDNADCRVRVACDGTINKAKDTDRAWTVEIAIPAAAMALGFDSPLKAGAWWRLNFSRVEWLRGEGQPEENWVWSPTGAVDMHMPERWGYLYFADAPVGTRLGTPPMPYNMAAYRMAWAMFYAQRDHYAAHHNYLRDVAGLRLTDSDRAMLPEDAALSVEATQNTFVVRVTLPAEHQSYCVNQDGRFTLAEVTPREVKNWCWTGMSKFETLPEWQAWFSKLRDCGIAAVLFEGYDEDIYKACKEAGLEAHYWKWTMNRAECLTTHPDWFAVSRSGKSCYDQPAYVDYYRFLCPNHEGVAEYLAADYVKEAHRPYVDGVHLDYVRMPDVVLPVSLWQNYGIDQTRELPDYDFCYCDVCRAKFKAATGRDPMQVAVPQEDQSWINFRLDAITRVVDAITRAVKADGSFISAAVFPGPTMAKKMVRQDWGNWHLDAYFPMTYNGFYYEGPEWIGRSVSESVQAVAGRAAVYPGLMCPDIKGDDFERALDAAYGAGAAGVSFFDGPDDAHLLRLKAYLQRKGYKVK